MFESFKNICTPIRQRFSAYLDGDINGLEMQQIEAHLHTCPACRTEFEEWQTIQRTLSNSAAHDIVPDDLALRLRIAISHERSNTQRSLTQRFVDRWELLRDNTLRPFAVQATVAVAGVFLFVACFGLFGVVAAPTAVEANDEPLAGFSSAHYLYSAQGSDDDAMPFNLDSPLMVEAKISAEGRVYDYRIVSGPQDANTQQMLRDKMLHAVFEPAQLFGSPVRSQVLLTYSGISVKG